MTNSIRLAACAAFALCAACASAIADPTDKDPAWCAAKAKGPYGFQCHGMANVGAGLEPVAFIGTVAGDGSGIYEGYGTFNSSLGSSKVHVKGPATFDRQCFGHVSYTTNEILLPGGGVVPLPPLEIDFTVVAGGSEILGMPVAAPGVTGNLVPRQVCRLVKIHE